MSESNRAVDGFSPLAADVAPHGTRRASRQAGGSQAGSSSIPPAPVLGCVVSGAIVS